MILSACEGVSIGIGDASVGSGTDAHPAADSGAENPEIPAPPLRCLGYSPAAYFYQVTLGRTGFLRFTLSNRCARPLQILSAEIVGDSETFTIDPLPLPRTLEFEEVLRIPVRFAPLEPKTYQTQVAIRLDDPEQPEIRVRLTGEGVGGELRPLPARLQLDPAPVSCRSSSITVGLWNEGPGPMYVYSIELDGPDAAAFSFRHEVALPRDVPAFEGLGVELGFHPTRQGEHSASLLVTYNGRQSPARVPITATAFEAGSREERFVLPPKAEHDLVFLVPPENLDRGVQAALLDFLLEVNREDAIDLRLFVTPTGAFDAALGQPAACAGFSSTIDLSSVSPALLEVLVPCMLSVARTEAIARSSDVLLAALERSLSTPEGQPPDLRPSAMTHSVFTTFIDASKVPLPFVLGALAAFPQERLPAVFVHGYEYPAPGQPGAQGARHHLLIRATGGLFVDQQSAAWSRFFGALYLRMKGGPRPLVLGLACEAATLEVIDLVKGSTVSASLDSRGRRVWVPTDAGPELLLRYEPRCSPPGLDPG